MVRSISIYQPKNEIERERKFNQCNKVDPYHNLCLDKKDIILAEIEASEHLLKYISDKDDEDRQLLE